MNFCLRALSRRTGIINTESYSIPLPPPRLNRLRTGRARRGFTVATRAMNNDEHSCRVVGSMLGTMCGDVLGACVEGWDVEALMTQYPEGLTSFQGTPRGFGQYTDDSQMAIALAKSLVACGRCKPDYAAQAYAQEFDPRRGYGGTAVQILMDLKAGAPWDKVATTYIPQGSFGNGGAMRIAPVGLAYRNAAPDDLHRAVADALACTHVHPLGVDGAFIQAAAVAHLCKTSAGTASPRELLSHLHSLARTDEMKSFIDAVQDGLQQASSPQPGPAPAITSWRQHFASPQWQQELCTMRSACQAAFQIKATDAVACALCALCFHWGHPRDAVVAAVHYGGDTDTIAAMTGAMAGALHGEAWLPQHWLDNLENGESGRDEVVKLSQELSQLDVRD